MKRAYHIHTTFSDGRCSVNEVINTTKAHQIDELSICDHDTFQGVIEANGMLMDSEIRLVPGIEISAKNSYIDIPYLQSNYSLHILGYHFDINNKLFFERVSNISNQNNTMCREIITRWKNVYPQLNFEEVKLHENQQWYYKTNIAEYLMSLGIVDSIDEAFTQIINSSLTKDLKTFGITITDSIKYIKEAGGYAIWAHPFEIFKVASKVQISIELVERLLLNLIDFGLDGIEVYYEKYTHRQIDMLNRLADKYNLLKYGGSDYHGRLKDVFMCSKWK